MSNEIVPLGDRYWWLKQDDPGFKAFIAKTGVDPLKYAQHLENEIFESPPVTMREFLYSPDFCDFKGDLWPKCQVILEEFDDNKYREAYLGLGRGCVAKGSEVYDASTGLWCKVENLASGFVAGAYDNGRYSESLATGFAVTGRGRILKIELAGGITVRVFEGHRFLGRKYSTPIQALSRKNPEWRRAGDIRNGELLAVSRRVSIQESVSIGADKAFFLGAMLGDGHFPGRRTKTVSWALKGGGSNSREYSTLWGSAGFYCAYPPLRKRFEEVLSGLGVSFRSTPKKENPSCLATRFSMRRHPVMKELMDSCDLGSKVAGTKVVPEQIFRLPDSELASFLEGIYSTDGWCGKYKRNRRGDFQFQIGLVSKSKALVEGVRKLLLRFGVASRIYPKVSREFGGGPKVYGQAWVLTVVGASNYRRFAQHINIIGYEDVLKEMAEAPRVSFEEDDFYWVRVKSVVEDGVEDYYDCTVPGPSNYIHDFGVVGHNSGKSITGALFLARSIYWLNNLKNPWKYFGLRRNTLLTVINVSISGLQAQSVIFDTLCDIIENGKYFKNKFTKRTALGHADLYFPDKRIKAVSGHSGSTVWRGYAIYAAVADEASWFVTKANKDNAEEIYTVLKGSMQTRFEGRYKLLVISSLKSRNDFMTKSLNTMRKQAKAEKAKGKGQGVEGIDTLCLEHGIVENNNI